MSIWYCIPSARPDGGTIPKWLEAGYKVFAWRDTDAPSLPSCTDEHHGPYPGYAETVNTMALAVLRQNNLACDWIVTGGDDVLPDQNHTPEEIAAQCTEHFGGTFGVMQPTGDRWADGSIDRICGSPWMGREFCQRMYGGQGPLWPGWFHCFVDEELQCVAKRMGVLWQRPDLTHEHKHWIRRDGPEDVDWEAVEPEHLKDKNVTLQRDRPLFNRRKIQGFPGHVPLAVCA